jgi:hypothetical protein
VGHLQYLAGVLVLGFAALLHSPGNWRAMKPAWILPVYFIWLQIALLGYVAAAENIYYFPQSKEYMGLIHFVLTVLVVADLFRRRGLREQAAA